MGMTLREVRRRCEHIAATLKVPRPFDLDSFLGRLGADRGRPVQLLRFAFPPGAPCGLLLATDTGDYVVVSDAIRGVQAEHVALHEVSHLLCGHDRHTLDEATLGRLLPHLAPDTVRTMMSRAGYSTIQDQEAEVLASLLRQRAGLWASPVPSTSPDPVVRRLGSSLEHGSRG